MGLIAFLKTQFIVHLLIGFVFVVSGLIINFVQLCTLILWPINKQFYRRVNCRLAYSLWSQLVMLLEWWSGTECTLFSDQATVDKFGKEHVIIILNHNFEIDFLCGWTMTERFGVLGSSKVLAKKELLYVPLIGWTWYFLEIVFCKRKWEEDRDTVIKGLKCLSDYPEYMWFLLYCEGTRFTETKHRISMEVAESKGLPKLKYHLLPRTKGFTTAVQCLRGTVSAVYDVTLNFRGNKNPSLLGILYGKKYEADMCVRRFPLEDIPVDEKEAANWLHKLYQEKDALQEMYNQEGIFPGRQFKPPRRPWTLLNFLFWATVLLSPLFTFGFGIFSSGSPLLILAFLGFVGAGNESYREEGDAAKAQYDAIVVINFDKCCIQLEPCGTIFVFASAYVSAKVSCRYPHLWMQILMDINRISADLQGSRYKIYIHVCIKEPWISMFTSADGKQISTNVQGSR